MSAMSQISSYPLPLSVYDEARFWFGLLRRLVIRDLASVAASLSPTDLVRWYYEREEDYRNFSITAQPRPRNSSLLDLPEELISSYRFRLIRQRHQFKQILMRNDLRALKQQTWRLPETVGLYIPFRYRQTSRLLSWFTSQFVRPYLQLVAGFSPGMQRQLRVARRFRLRTPYQKPGHLRYFYRSREGVRGYVRALKVLYLRIKYFYFSSLSRVVPLLNCSISFVNVTRKVRRFVCRLGVFRVRREPVLSSCSYFGVPVSSLLLRLGGGTFSSLFFPTTLVNRLCRSGIGVQSPLGRGVGVGACHYRSLYRFSLPRTWMGWLSAKFSSHLKNFYRPYQSLLYLSSVVQRYRVLPLFWHHHLSGCFLPPPLKLASFPASSFNSIFTSWSEQRSRFHYTFCERTFGFYPDISYALLVRRPRSSVKFSSVTVSPVFFIPGVAESLLLLLQRTACAFRGSLTGLLTQGVAAFIALFPFRVAPKGLASKLSSVLHSRFTVLSPSSFFLPSSLHAGQALSHVPGRIVITINSNTLFMTVVDGVGHTLAQVSSGVITRLARLARRRRPLRRPVLKMGYHRRRFMRREQERKFMRIQLKGKRSKKAQRKQRQLIYRQIKGHKRKRLPKPRTLFVTEDTARPLFDTLVSVLRGVARPASRRTLLYMSKLRARLEAKVAKLRGIRHAVRVSKDPAPSLSTQLQLRLQSLSARIPSFWHWRRQQQHAVRSVRPSPVHASVSLGSKVPIPHFLFTQQHSAFLLQHYRFMMRRKRKERVLQFRRSRAMSPVSAFWQRWARWSFSLPIARSVSPLYYSSESWLRLRRLRVFQKHFPISPSASWRLPWFVRGVSKRKLHAQQEARCQSLLSTCSELGSVYGTQMFVLDIRGFSEDRRVIRRSLSRLIQALLRYITRVRYQVQTKLLRKMYRHTLVPKVFLVSKV